MNIYKRVIYGILLCLTTTFLQAQEKFGVIYSNPAIPLVHQRIDTTDNQGLRRLIDTSDTFVSCRAALVLALRGYKDIIPQIISRFETALSAPFAWKMDLEDYIVALYLLQASEAWQLAHTYLDSMLARNIRGSKLTYTDTMPLRILLNLGDYSRFDVFNVLIDNELANISPYGRLSTGFFTAFGSRPEYRAAVYNRIKEALQHRMPNIRKDAVYLLPDFRDFPETQTLLQQVALADSSFDVRLDAMRWLRGFYRDPIVLKAAEAVAIATKDSMEVSGAVIQIESYSTPQALVSLKNIQSNITPSGFIYNFISDEIRFYKPPEPDSTVPVVVLIDSLVSSKHQVVALGWLADKNFVNELDNHLENAQKHLVKGDSANARKEVEKFQEKIKKEYEKTIDDAKKNKPRDKRFVTVEGWKFLYYNAQYIIARLPAKK